MDCTYGVLISLTEFPLVEEQSWNLKWWWNEIILYVTMLISTFICKTEDVIHNKPSIIQKLTLFSFLITQVGLADPESQILIGYIFKTSVSNASISIEVQPKVINYFDKPAPTLIYKPYHSIKCSKKYQIKSRSKSPHPLKTTQLMLHATCIYKQFIFLKNYLT